MRTQRSVDAALLLIAVVATPAMSFAEGPVRIAIEENVLSIDKGSSPLLRYAYRNVPYKPCVQELFTPDGINILRDSPADHKHHHALMYAVSVDGLNFWEERREPGRQKHIRFSNVAIGTKSRTPHGCFTEKLDWTNPKTEELLLEESRTIQVCRSEDDESTLLSWQSEFSVPEGKKSVTLSGSHYFGLGMRFVQSMDRDARFRNSTGEAGKVVRGDERLTRAKWCAISGQANGKPVTIAMFCHPDNLRHPTHWFTMSKPFAYLSATMNLHREPLKINADEPLVLRYGVAVWDGQIENNRIDRRCRRWIENN